MLSIERTWTSGDKLFSKRIDLQMIKAVTKEIFGGKHYDKFNAIIFKYNYLILECYIQANSNVVII